MSKEGLAGAKTASGNYVRQALAYIHPASHRVMHQAWDSFVGAKKMQFLQAKKGNQKALRDALKQGRISPTKIFDTLEEFCIVMARQNVDGAGDAWVSIQSLRSRMGY